MLALPSSVGNGQKSDGVRALKDLQDRATWVISVWVSDFDGNELDGLRRTVQELQAIVRDLIDLLQSANAEELPTNTMAEKSANKK